MPLEKLTERAKEALLKLPEKESVTAGEILDVLGLSSGMSNVLLRLFPKLKVSKKVKVPVDVFIKEAYYQASKLEQPYVGTEHLLLALLKITESPNYKETLSELTKMNVFPSAMKTLEKGTSKNYYLELFGENLNNKVFRDVDKPVLSRPEYDSLVSTLLQKNNSNALLVGEKGVGKSSLIDLLAQNINSLEVPPALVGYQVIEFDLLGFMTNAFNKNSLESVLMSFAEELVSLDRVILSIKNFQNVFFATSTGFTVPMFYSMFRETLDNAGVKFISSMTSSLYYRIVAENEHIFEGMNVVEVNEPPEALTKNILKLNSGYLGKYHNVDISLDLINLVYKRAKEDIKDMKFPQKGLDLLDQACSRAILKHRIVPDSYKNLVDRAYMVSQTLDKNLESGDFKTAIKTRRRLKKMETSLVEEEQHIFHGGSIRLTPSDVESALKEFGVDKQETPAAPAHLDSLPSLSRRIKKRIIGQDEAIDTVVRSLIRAKLGLRPKKRPVGNFLFLGPTGVGKTELAKILASEAFTSRDNSLIRLDMSDFAEKHNVARLIGAPPGYVGYGEGGELTSKIELQPESVVLFDEIEKAHPDVLNILLQIMEEGELSDAKGNTYDFSKAIVILTSNLGTEIIHKPEIGFDHSIIDDANLETRLKSNLKKILKAELINRFDEVIVFKRLKKEDQLRVLDLLIEEASHQLKSQNIKLKVSGQAKRHILDKGFSMEYGARALRRTVEKELLDKIAEVLIDPTIKKTLTQPRKQNRLLKIGIRKGQITASLM